MSSHDRSFNNRTPRPGSFATSLVVVAGIIALGSPVHYFLSQEFSRRQEIERATADTPTELSLARALRENPQYQTADIGDWIEYSHPQMRQLPDGQFETIYTDYRHKILDITVNEQGQRCFIFGRNGVDTTIENLVATEGAFRIGQGQPPRRVSFCVEPDGM